MPNYFQWITLLLIESIYFASIRIKGPHTSVWIIPSNSIGPLESTSKIQILGPLGSTSKFKSLDLWEARPNSNPWTSGKHVQNSIFGPLGSTSKIPFHRTSGKHVQNSISMDLWEARPNFKSIGTLGSTFKFKSIRPLGSMSKLQTIKPLGSTSKIQIHWTSRKHV